MRVKNSPKTHFGIVTTAAVADNEIFGGKLELGSEGFAPPPLLAFSFVFKSAQFMDPNSFNIITTSAQYKRD